MIVLRKWALLLVTLPVMAQRATVTFYTPTSVIDSALPGDKRGVFFGSIYDHDQFLFLFQEHGFEKNQHRFVTMSISPGDHDFVAAYGKDSSQGAYVRFTAEAGKNYFLRANSESLGVLVVGSVKPLLNQVSCTTAHQEMGEAKFLVPRRIGKDAVLSNGDAYLSPCP